MTNNIIKIGEVLKWRGAYSPDKTYYKENLVTLCNCIFKCEENGLTGVPPCIQQGDGHYELANTSSWTVLLNSLDALNRWIDGGEITQDFGDNADKTISQKILTERFDAVTDELDDLHNTVKDEISESVNDLKAKMVMAVSLDQNTGQLILQYDDDSDLIDATLRDDGKLVLTFDI